MVSHDICQSFEFSHCLCIYDAINDIGIEREADGIYIKRNRILCLAIN